MPTPSGSPLHLDDLRWQDYEELVKDIYQVLGKASGVVIECWGSGCKVEGPPGIFHQVDVLTSHTVGMHKYTTAISCKYWNKKVGLPVVRDWDRVVQDARLNKGVIVSQMGFTKPARDYASAKGMGLVELRKPLDDDWSDYIKEVHIMLTVVPPPVVSIKLQITLPQGHAVGESLASGGLPWPSEQIFIQRADTREGESLRDIVEEARANLTTEAQHTIEFPTGSVMVVPEDPSFPQDGYPVTAVDFSVEEALPLTDEIVIRPPDHVYMIMEILFEGRRFTITTDGVITENFDQTE